MCRTSGGWRSPTLCSLANAAAELPRPNRRDSLPSSAPFRLPSMARRGSEPGLSQYIWPEPITFPFMMRRTWNWRFGVAYRWRLLMISSKPLRGRKAFRFTRRLERRRRGNRRPGQSPGVDSLPINLSDFLRTGSAGAPGWRGGGPVPTGPGWPSGRGLARRTGAGGRGRSRPGCR